MRTITRESMAWQFLADKLDQQGKMSLYIRFAPDVKPEPCYGLCAEISILSTNNVITPDVAYAMHRRIHALGQERTEADFSRYGAYYWKPRQVAPRIIAAQLNAILAKQDERREARVITRTLAEDRIAA